MYMYMSVFEKNVYDMYNSKAIEEQTKFKHDLSFQALKPRL